MKNKFQLKFLAISSALIIFFGFIFVPNDLNLRYFLLFGWILVLNFLFWHSGFLSYDKSGRDGISPAHSMAVSLFCVASFIISIAHYLVGDYNKFFFSIQAILIAVILLLTNTLNFASSFAKVGDKNVSSPDELHKIILTLENRLKNDSAPKEQIEALKKLREKIKYSLNSSMTTKACYKELVDNVNALKQINIDDLENHIKQILSLVDDLRI